MQKHGEFLLRQTGAEHFRLMPAKRLFALGVGHMRRRGLASAARPTCPPKSWMSNVVKLSELEWRVLTALKREFAPKEIMAELGGSARGEAGVPLETFCEVAEELNRRKVIGRFSTFLEHVKPLSTGERVTRFNALFHWAVPAGREIEAGSEVGRHHILTHAYWREGGAEFRNVNVMAVAHGTDKDSCCNTKRRSTSIWRHQHARQLHQRVLGRRSEIKPSEISPFAYEEWCRSVGLEPESMRE